MGLINYLNTNLPITTNNIDPLNIVTECSTFLDEYPTPIYKNISSSSPFVKIKIRHRKSSSFNCALNDILILDENVWTKSVSASLNHTNKNYQIFIPNGYRSYEFNTTKELNELQSTTSNITDLELLSDVLMDALDPTTPEAANNFLFTNIPFFYAIRTDYINQYFSS